MRWMIEITELSSDKRFLTDILKSLKVELYQEDNVIYLISDQFETESISTEVWDLAKKMRDIVSEVTSNYGTSLSFKLVNLYEQEDNSRRKHVFLSGKIESSTTISATLKVISAREISDEDRAKLEVEQQEFEYQKKLALVSCRVLSAFRDERALTVQRFLQQDLNPVRMYHIYELVRDDLGKEINSLASKKNWTRFTRSVNHQKVFGDDSRHIASSDKPPPDPMSLKEAQAFISDVADLWLKRKGHGFC